MAFTYTPDFTTQRDRVRREIGDVVTTDQQLSDAELAYAGTVEGSDLAVAARCCEWIAASLARKADMTEGHLSVRCSQRAVAYERKAVMLRARAATESGAYLGGESVSDKETTNDDTDRVSPAFFRGQLDNPFATQSTPGDVISSDEND